MLAILDPTAQFVLYLIAVLLFAFAAVLAWTGYPERALACIALGLALAFVPTAWNLTDAL